MSKRKIKIVDVEQELLLRIGSDDTHSIPWEVLKEIGNKLEKLLFSLAELNGEESIDVRERFDLRFTGFYKGSSIPAWSFREVEQLSITPTEHIPHNVSTQFSYLMSEVSKGDFRQLSSIATTPEEKRKIVHNVADFVNSSGSYGMSIVRRTSTRKYSHVYSLRQMSAAAVKELSYVSEQQTSTLSEEQTAVGKILLSKTSTGRTKKKLISVYRSDESKLTMMYKEILHGTRVYVLRHNEFFIVVEEGKGIILENEKLDLYASGKNQDEARNDLFYQFDSSYQRLMELPDEQLSVHMLSVKKNFLMLVESIKSV